MRFAPSPLRASTMAVATRSRDRQRGSPGPNGPVAVPVRPELRRGMLWHGGRSECWLIGRLSAECGVLADSGVTMLMMYTPMCTLASRIT